MAQGISIDFPAVAFTRFLLITLISFESSSTAFYHGHKSSAFLSNSRSRASATSRSSRSSIDMVQSKLTYGSTTLGEADFNATVLVGKKESLLKFIPGKLDLASEVYTAMLDSVSGPKGSSVSTFGGSPPKKITFCVLPEKTTRNNHPMSVHTITSLLKSSCSGKGNVKVVIVSEEQNVAPLASAVGKAFPLFSEKTSGSDNDQKAEREVAVSFLDENGSPVENENVIKACSVVSDGVRLAGRLMDMPPDQLTTTAYAEECRQIVKDLPHTTMVEIVGEDLNKKGYGGLYGVGKAATCPPRMVIMTYDPPNVDEKEPVVALVGKGIVYDTGGLSLKGRTGMPGMKHDMGGSAGMLGGFCAAVKLGTPKKITCILCLAENAIGPLAVRNDDILKMYSGKTVEINNSDAEGRLVLADGVAHATKHIDGLGLVMDMATLTGAQLVATGKKHAGILANTEDLEKQAVAAGLYSGDFCFPLLYAPEFLKDEFKSKVADMKNSVKDRGNAQTSCAGHFIESHLHADYKGGWLHVDMAGPGSLEERGTGYGVGLVLAVLGAPGF